MSAIANIRSWLSWHYWSDGGGAPLWEGIAETADDLADWLRAALASRFPSKAPADALQEIAYTQNLQPPTLKTAVLRRYLANPWTKWEKAGTRGRLLDSAALFGELALLGVTNAEIVSWRDLADRGAATAFGGDTSCWYLKIPQPNSFEVPGLWDDGATWDDGAAWDVGDPDGLIPGIRAAIAKWSPAASSCRYIEIELTDGHQVRVPTYWWWELDANGNALDYYNSGY